jgi:hypothetical protein
MANAKDLRRMALALEGTTEAPHFDRAAFKGWTTAKLSALSTADLEAALETAWRHAVPKKPRRK